MPLCPSENGLKVEIKFLEDEKKFDPEEVYKGQPNPKVLRSAAANAKNNLGFDETKILVKEAYADQGPVMKRFRPRAQGRAYRILKPTSHITIVVSG